MPTTHGNPEEPLASLLIDSVVDYAIFVLDPHGVVRSWNPGAERLKGYAPQEIIGRNFSTFYTPEDRDTGLPARLLARAAAEGRVTHTGWRVRKDGTRFYGDVTITALRDEDGTLQGFAKVTRDRTDQYEADVAMAHALDRERRAAQELARLEEARTQFMAAVGHDLRTPISVIRGSVSLLAGGDDDDRDELIDVIQRNVERLLSMTQQLSELARLGRGQLRLERQTTELADAVRECIRSLRPLLAGIDVQVDVVGTVAVDRIALQRMLVNLLSNAARHSPADSRIAISTRREPSFVVLMVEDQGPGVPPEERERIFDEFRQGRHNEQAEGLGLGLSIVRHYAQAHGGRAWVEEGDAGGARFGLSLPAAEASPADPEPRAGRADLPSS